MITCLTQVRIGSQRLPGKSLFPICDRPLFLFHLDRIKKACKVTNFAVLTSCNPRDDIIEYLCEKESIDCFRGEENDVLHRFYSYVSKSSVQYFVRTTGDCPFICNKLLDKMIEHYLNHLGDYDYMSNIIKQSYPYGVHIEIFTRQAIIRAHSETRSSYDREHVTPYIYNNPDKFKLFNYKNNCNLTNFRLAIDTIEDYKFVSQIFSGLNNNYNANFLDAVKFIKETT